MPHLHEVLAVDKELEHVAWQVVDEAITTFTKKIEHFHGFDRRYSAYDESKQHEVDALAETKVLATTVPEKLQYVADHVVRFIDALAQKEASNQLARGNIVTQDDKLVIKDLPATLLLALEGKLTRLRNMYAALPTLQPGVAWELDLQLGKYVWRGAKPVIKQKTEKVPRFKVLYEATKEHPAQVEKWFSDEPVAESVMTIWSGMITPSQKATLLRRLDDLVQATKKARMRANEQEVVPIKIGKQIMDYLHGDFEEMF